MPKSTEDITSHPKDYYKSLTEVLKCARPDCGRYLSRPVKQCSSGHSLCNLCTKQMCPICNHDFIETENRVLNSIVQKLIVPCINRPKGCKDYFPPRYAREHEKICQYGMVKCRIRGCGRVIAHTVLWEHTISEHPGSACSANFVKIYVKIKDSSTYDHFILFGVYAALFNGIFTFSREGIINAVAQLIHTPKPKKYYYEIEYMDKDDYRQLMFSGPVLSEDEDMEDKIIDGGTSIKVSKFAKNIPDGGIYKFLFRIVPEKLSSKHIT